VTVSDLLGLSSEHPHVRFSKSRRPGFFCVSGIFDNHIASVGIFIWPS
jgi:hypothetical protein